MSVFPSVKHVRELFVREPIWCVEFQDVTDEGKWKWNDYNLRSFPQSEYAV